MIVRIYTDFSKRVNSTKVPGDTEGTDVTVKLKEGTSIYNPSFILSSGGVKPQIKYLKWDTRYYYVEDVVITTDNLYSIDCSEDVLASHKDAILSMSAFVKYSTSNYDVGIPDLRLSMNDTAVIKTSSLQLSYTSLPDNYVVSYISSSSGANPIVALNESGIKSLTGKIHSNAFAELFTDTESSVRKMLTDCSQAITYCRYLPYCDTYSASGTITLVGGYSTGISAVQPRKYRDTQTITIPWNYDSGDFRNRSQFSHMILFIGAYGAIDLNVDDYIGKSTISIITTLDSNTGDISFTVDNRMVFRTRIGYDVQLGTTTSGNLGNMASNASAMVGSALSGNIMGTVASGFNTVLSAFTTTPSSVGTVGGDATTHECKLVMISHNTNADPSNMASTLGRPLNKVMSLSSLTGYVECANASVGAQAPRHVKDEINNFLNGGIYIE